MDNPESITESKSPPKSNHFVCGACPTPSKKSINIRSYVFELSWIQTDRLKNITCFWGGDNNASSTNERGRRHKKTQNYQSKKTSFEQSL